MRPAKVGIECVKEGDEENESCNRKIESNIIQLYYISVISPQDQKAAKDGDVQVNKRSNDQSSY